MGPVAPTAGTVRQLQPAAGVSETNVVLVGTESLRVTVAAAVVAELLVTVIV
jgi:hypothetical protein